MAKPVTAMEILYATKIVDGETIDLVLVERVLDHDPNRYGPALRQLSTAERREAMREAAARGRTVSWIATRLRTNNEHVSMILFGSRERSWYGGTS